MTCTLTSLASGSISNVIGLPLESLERRLPLLYRLVWEHRYGAMETTRDKDVRHCYNGMDRRFGREGGRKSREGT